MEINFMGFITGVCITAQRASGLFRLFVCALGMR